MADEAFLQQGPQVFLAGQGLFAAAVPPDAEAAEDVLHLGHAGGAHEAGALHGAAKDAPPMA